MASPGLDIASLLRARMMAGGAPPMMPPGPGAGPPGVGPPGAGPPPPGPPQGNENQPIQILQQMISLAQQYLRVEPDQVDKATMTQVLQKLQAYLAKDQQDKDASLQGKLNPRLLRKTGA